MIMLTCRRTKPQCRQLPCYVENGRGNKKKRGKTLTFRRHVVGLHLPWPFARKCEERENTREGSKGQARRRGLKWIIKGNQPRSQLRSSRVPYIMLYMRREHIENFRWIEHLTNFHSDLLYKKISAPPRIPKVCWSTSREARVCWKALPEPHFIQFSASKPRKNLPSSSL